MQEGGEENRTLVIRVQRIYKKKRRGEAGGICEGESDNKEF